jgi:hypothetical protein
MILTRYLYVKELVENSLAAAILEKHSYTEAAFWAYELYFSGFEQEVLTRLTDLYETRFTENHPRLGIYLEKKSRELADKPELIAIFVKNLTMKQPHIKESPSGKFVNVKPHHIISFMTKELNGPNWKFLREVCLYGVLGKCSQEDRIKYRQDWLSYVVQTPVWRERMKGYENWTEDEEEDFHNRWDYEPDEQPLIVQERCMGVLS